MTTPIETLIQDLSPDAKLDLFEIDLSPVTGTNTPDDHIYFHSGTNSLRQQVVWQGKSYTNLSIDISGFDYTTKGTMPKPKLQVSNIFSTVTAVIESAEVGGDVTGARVIRRQTYARYLDAVNFPPRVNNINNSEASENWVPTNVVVTYDAGSLDLRGEATVRRMTETAVGGNHMIAVSGSKALVIGQPLTAWVELKAGALSGARIVLYGTSGVTGFVTVDLSSGRIIDTGSAVDVGCVPLDESGWYKVWVTSTVVSVGTAGLRVQCTRGTSNGYVGDSSMYLLLGRTHMASGRIGSTNMTYQYVGTTFVQNPEADPTKYLPDEVFYIERKVSEDPISVEFELASALDLSSTRLPRRVISEGICTWDEYRGEGCEYSGTAYFDASDNPVTDPAKDICSRSPNGCKLRHEAQYGPKAPLPFGGFPGARAYQG